MGDVAKDFIRFVDALNTTKEEYAKRKKRLEKLETDFKSLNKPGLFNDAYPEMLIEINRRKLFNTAVTVEVDQINRVIEAETEER